MKQSQVEHPDGFQQELFTDSFDMNKQVGPWKRFFDNGQLWDEGGYVDGKKVGEWKVYDRDGVLKLHKVFKPRKIAGEKSRR